jgi:hypothetical protein
MNFCTYKTELSYKTHSDRSRFSVKADTETDTVGIYQRKPVTCKKLTQQYSFFIVPHHDGC